MTDDVPPPPPEGWVEPVDDRSPCNNPKHTAADFDPNLGCLACLRDEEREALEAEPDPDAPEEILEDDGLHDDEPPVPDPDDDELSAPPTSS